MLDEHLWDVAAIACTEPGRGSSGGGGLDDLLENTLILTSSPHKFHLKFNIHAISARILACNALV